MKKLCEIYRQLKYVMFGASTLLRTMKLQPAKRLTVATCILHCVFIHLHKSVNMLDLFPAAIRLNYFR